MKVDRCIWAELMDYVASSNNEYLCGIHGLQSRTCMLGWFDRLKYTVSYRRLTLSAALILASNLLLHVGYCFCCIVDCP